MIAAKWIKCHFEDFLFTICIMKCNWSFISCIYLTILPNVSNAAYWFSCKANGNLIICLVSWYLKNSYNLSILFTQNESLKKVEDMPLGIMQKQHFFYLKMANVLSAVSQVVFCYSNNLKMALHIKKWTKKNWFGAAADIYKP